MKYFLAKTDPETYSIDDAAVALLCEFDYPGNIRALRNFIYELTSYIDENRVISIELVQFVLTKLNARVGNHITGTNDEGREAHFPPNNDLSASQVSIALDVQHSLLRSTVEEGDIILPLELCVLRRGETFKQWSARAKRYSIEAARQATGGTMKSAAQRLGLTRSSLRSHLQRAKRAQNNALFDWQRDSNGKSSD